MKNESEILKSFTLQAPKFESNKMNFSDSDYLKYMTEKIAPDKTDTVLEVAAGTCVCGRAVAPYSKKVVCVDLTPAMLDVGRAASEKEHIENIEFVRGDASDLPFPDNSFDIVFSRLAFHHFPDIKKPFAEQVRVLKPGGRLFLIDMEATASDLRKIQDNIEKLRDPSHIKNLSESEMLSLFFDNGLTIELTEKVKRPLKLLNWLEHTDTPEKIRASIIFDMKNELSGGEKTGFFPYLISSEIYFDRSWVLVSGRKPK